ncbi:proline--tRNA ligase [Actinotignum urinale]|uniref:proline--tRNA ligase n=1 Tax=Actinotignum urinale TaxID=190146 RepID=UPI001FE33BCE|nr:proline--tRNA ligase [Actinotignum urinale]MDY5129170.1 proline--tRNA ligase [Actinotignum urinale]WIK59235.1 proline--tRNA ligase [Actinotignum urinale]
MLKLSSLFVRTLREDPADAEVASHKLLVRAGYIRRVAPGIYTWLPLGLRVLRNVENIVREEMNRAGAQEVLFPALLPREPYEATNRWTEYGPTLFKLQDRKKNDMLLAPTHEEMFTLLVKDLYSSYKDLPLTLYQIQTKYRDEARPRAGVIRGREFVMKDAYSFDMDEAGLDESYNVMREAYQRVYKRLGLPFAIVSAMSGAMGGSRSEEFLFPTAIGEDTFVRSPGGYAANTEAVTTPMPEELDASGVPEAASVRTPGASTIASLVDVSNEVNPREDRPWTAADTLKSVVIVATHPDGEKELIVIAIPGDREVDMKRVEAALAPAEVAMADHEAFEPYPELVPGFLGPEVVGPQSERRAQQSEDERPVLRLLLDAHVARGSSWIVGGNSVDVHRYNVVYGRDFEADGAIEAAEVLAGDPAPDGSGALEIARGIEIGHIFQLGRKYAESLGLTVLDENGKTRVVTMGSYGIGVSRALASIAEHYHDDKGLIWPTNVAPAHVHVLATGKEDAVFETAEKIAAELESAGIEVIYDDRRKMSAGVKFKDYELLGMPYGVVVGKGLKDGNVEIRTRATGESVNVPVDQTVASVVDLVKKDPAGVINA